MKNCIEKFKHIALLALAVVIVAGCGGGSTSAPGDTTAPTTTVAPAVSGDSNTGLTLSATIDENGTGYYLVQPAAASAPTVAAVQAGTSFAMAANVAATPATIPGRSTAYRIYFVAKDAANNVQAAVQSVAVTPPLTALAQGVLTWMPSTFYDTWPNADAYCTTTTINGVTGWRMPTQPELSALYTSGAMNGQGWTLNLAWSSAVYNAGNHYIVSLVNGSVTWDSDTSDVYVSCVR